jgi:hypothetical protein
MAPWKHNVWVDDDGSLTVGTAFDAEHMNNIELGLVEVHDGVAAASGMAGSALTKAASGITAAGSALITGQEANLHAAAVEQRRQEALLRIEGQVATVTEATSASFEYLPSVEKIQGVLVIVAQDYVTKLALGTPAVQVGAASGSAVKLVATLETAGRGAIKVYFCSSERMYQKNENGKIPVSITGMASSVKKQVSAFFLTGPGPLRASMTPVATVAASSLSQSFVGPEEEAGNESILIAAVQSGTVQPSEAGLVQGQIGTTWTTVAANTSIFRRGEGVLRPGVGFITGGTKTNWGGLGITIAPKHDWGEVTALPAGAGIGDVCHFVADATNSIIWDLEYDARNGTYPWRKIGGAPIRVATVGGNVVSGTPGYYIGTLTTPLAGLGTLSFGTPLAQNVSPATTQLVIYARRNLANIDAAHALSIFIANGQFGGGPLYCEYEKLEVAKGDAIQLYTEANNGATWQVVNPYIVWDPGRVG